MAELDIRSSFRQQAWARLRRNRGAVAGMLLIAIAVVVSIVAYWVSPDGTPMANRMIVEIGGKHPGFSIDLLALPRQQAPEKVGFLKRLLDGQEEAVTWVPLSSYQAAGDSMIVHHFIDEETSLRESYPAGGTYIKHYKAWLGTDKFGRDILSRLLVGTRVSLSVGFIAVLISLTIGIFLGAIAGYFRGLTDEVVMWLVNVIWSVPTLLLVFAITLALGKGFWQVFIAVGLTMWVNVARIIRGQVLSLRELTFIEATRALGFGHARTIIKHILPNILGPVMVVAAGNFATAIVVEAGLSFLGVGVQPPQPSWGLMIKENYNFIITHNPLLALAPGVAIMLMVLAFNLLGNGLRDAMDVRQ
ncbi:ABC transporter permease [Chitinophaga sancti]|uniref:ABC transporter permease n=1 Tax=Chitinophaga sancti TaxID=1004 RepID=A0A1K1RJA3_9BACT|nr:ABC transporter permease [Chitinophaga sancti]WQD60717.1 ABC transporter permease [Chitinophaga sancti]WQG87155.1 ABC transporter permease [Chitinophaga sancti]SFW72109.1 peptide/nickel transport system permease protein [Chitinophaga sancti]